MHRSAFLLGLLLLLSSAMPAQGQSPSKVSGKKAFALSLVLPGLGHRYVAGGSWSGRATAHALADAGLWTTLLGSEMRRGRLVNDYETLAAAQAGAQVEGKGRRFFLNLATYLSSDAYVEAQLRNRAWTEVDYVLQPGFAWSWVTEEDFLRYREMREDAESLRRRRTFVAGVLVANRVIAALTALRAARRADTAPDVSISLGIPPHGAHVPMLDLAVRF